MVTPEDRQPEEVSVFPAGGHLVVAVPWDAAEQLQEYLRRNDVGVTAHLEPADRTARLEPWDGTDPHRLQFLVAQWKEARRKHAPARPKAPAAVP